MIGQMAITIAFLSWIYDLGSSVNPIFINAPSNSVLFNTSFICVADSNASWMVKFCEKVVWNYLRNRPTSTKI